MVLLSHSAPGDLTGKCNSRDLLVLEASSDVTVAARKPDLPKLRVCIIVLAPQCRFECGAPFVQCEGMKGKVYFGIDVETCKSKLVVSVVFSNIEHVQYFWPLEKASTHLLGAAADADLFPGHFRPA